MNNHDINLFFIFTKVQSFLSAAINKIPRIQVSKIQISFKRGNCIDVFSFENAKDGDGKRDRHVVLYKTSSQTLPNEILIE